MPDHQGIPLFRTISHFPYTYGYSIALFCSGFSRESIIVPAVRGIVTVEGIVCLVKIE